MLRTQKSVALFNVLILINGHQIDRPHAINFFLQGCNLLAHRIPVRGRRVAGHFFGRDGFGGGLAVVGDVDGPTIAAHFMQIHGIFFEDAFHELLLRHSLLRQFHFNLAFAFLQFGERIALVRKFHFAPLGPGGLLVALLREFRGLFAGGLALDAEPIYLAARFHILRFKLHFALSAFAECLLCAFECALQFLQPLLHRRLTLEQRILAFFSFGQGYFRFGQIFNGAFPSLALFVDKLFVDIERLLNSPRAFFHFANARAQSLRPALRTFLLFSEIAHLENHRVNFLMQDLPRILQRVKLAF